MSHLGVGDLLLEDPLSMPLCALTKLVVHGCKGSEHMSRCDRSFMIQGISFEGMIYIMETAYFCDAYAISAITPSAGLQVKQ